MSEHNMSKKQGSLSRREFLRNASVLVGAGVLAAACVPVAPAGQQA